MAGVEGLEPPTLGLEIRCSILLSYTPKGLASFYRKSREETQRAVALGCDGPGLIEGFALRSAATARLVDLEGFEPSTS